jgi:peptidoglycan/LPS O-acetylase OafA/YrhL
MQLVTNARSVFDIAPMQYRADIDGLRGLAVLAVVAFHAWPHVLPFGFLGVDVFFVISGYLITSDIVRRLQAGTFSLTDFYMRRVRRLFPGLIVVLAAVSVFGAVVLYPDEREQLARHVLASALFAQNFQLIGEAGYFDTASTAKPLLHLWSLAVEEQFYLLWPLLLVLRPRVLLIAVIALGSLVAFAVLPMDLAYYLPVTRFWEILAGALLAMAGRFPLLPTASPALVYVGRVSYPLYLWHWPLLVFLRLLVPETDAPATAAAVALSFALAVATYHWVEQPLRPAGALGQRVRVLASASVLAVVLAFGFALLPGDQRHADWIADLDATPDRTQMRECKLPEGLCLQTGASPTHALVGDSHADHLFDAISASRSGSWLLSYRNSCPPLMGVRVKIGRSGCESDELVRSLAANPTLQTVVLSFYGGYAEATNYAADHIGTPGTTMGPQDIVLLGPGDTKPERLSAGLARTVETLEAGGKSVVLLLDVPELPFRPRDCITRTLQAHHPCSIERSAALARQASLRAAATNVQRTHPRLRVFDPLETVCPAGRCQINRSGLLFYRDSHHLSVRGSRIVATRFGAWLAGQ